MAGETRIHPTGITEVIPAEQRCDRHTARDWKLNICWRKWMNLDNLQAVSRVRTFPQPSQPGKVSKICALGLPIGVAHWGSHAQTIRSISLCGQCEDGGGIYSQAEATCKIVRRVFFPRGPRSTIPGLWRAGVANGETVPGDCERHSPCIHCRAACHGSRR